jgi:CubicO group peptidase (beta-lactamase class C family)
MNKAISAYKRILSPLACLMLLATVSASFVATSFQPALAHEQQPGSSRQPGSSSQQPDFSELEKVVLEELKETNTPGAAIAIVSGDRVVFLKGFGVSNIETGAPVTPEMLFRIGSTTKMYTDAVLVSLAEEGKLRLDEPISSYVKGLSAKLSQVTTHQLMTHTAGIKDDAPSYGPHDESSMRETVRSWKDDYFFTEPGRVFSYSNPGLTLAGLVAEEVGRKPYADQVSERLFKPLGMLTTTFRPTMAMTYPLSQGHRAVGQSKPVVVRPFADNAAYWPAGFIFSSASDLARFAIAFMNGGKIEGRQVLSPGVIAKLSTGYADVHSVFKGGKYGYGLMMHEFRGVQVAEHGGAIDGFGCMFQMAPGHRFAVIVLTNKGGQRLDKSAEKAMELLLPLKAKEENKPGQELPVTEAEMANYAGTYSQAGVSLEILIKDGKLFFKQGPAQLPMAKVGENRFTVARPGAPRPLELVIVPGADGKAEYLHFGLRAVKKVSQGN